MFSVNLYIHFSDVSLIHISGMVRKNIVFAGVGNPINDLVCLESILNLANLKAEKIVIKKPNKCK